MRSTGHPHRTLDALRLSLRELGEGLLCALGGCVFVLCLLWAAGMGPAPADTSGGPDSGSRAALLAVWEQQ